MLGEAWQGEVTDLLDWISGAGYEGVEITTNMIGEYWDRPRDFARELEARGLALAAYAYGSPSGFTDLETRRQDVAGAARALAFVEAFPGAKLELGGAASPSREDLWGKLDLAIALYNQVGGVAAEAGVVACVHPHSHFGSLLESAEEYAYLLERLDPGCANWCPDTGHIIRGGQDLMACLRAGLDRIVHVHFKDVDADRRWVGLGKGTCDFAGVIALLEGAGYDGWVVGEEESEEARQDGVAAVRGNREYLRSLGY
jgi:sugar phosphate isomerase/epimerase